MKANCYIATHPVNRGTSGRSKVQSFFTRAAALAFILLLVGQTFTTIQGVSRLGSPLSDLNSLYANLKSFYNGLTNILTHPPANPVVSPQVNPPPHIQKIPGLLGAFPTFDPANGYLYMGGGYTIAVYNPASNSIVANITTGRFSNDGGGYIAYNSVNHNLYSTESDYGTVSIINGTSNTLLANVNATPGFSSIPEGIASAANGNVFVALSGGAGYVEGVSVLNGTGGFITRIHLPPPGCTSSCPDANAQDLAYDPVNNRIYVAGSCACIYIIDPTTNTLVGNIPIPSSSRDIAYDSSKNSLYVTYHNYVYYADAATNTYQGAVSLAPNATAVGASGIAYDSYNDYLYVAGNAICGYPEFLCAIFVINDANNSLVASIPVEALARALGVVYDPASNKIYVTISDGTDVLPSLSTQISYAPLNLQASANTNQIHLTWQPPLSRGGSTITSYTLYRSTSAGDEALLASGLTNTTYTDVVFINSQTNFYYYVTATNSFGESYPSNEAVATIGPDFTITANQTIINANAGSLSPTTSLNLQSYNGYNSSVSLSVKWAIAPTNVTALFSPTSVTPTGTSTLRFNVASSAQGGSFTFLVQATDGAITRNSQPIRLNIAGTANKPNAPQNLQATANPGYVKLTWNPPSSDGGTPITNYTVYRGTASNGETLLAIVGNQLTWIDNGVTGGTSYYYYVRALNYAGADGNSNEASATPTTPSTPSLIVSITGQGSVTDGFGETYSATVTSNGSLVVATISWSVAPPVGSPNAGTGSKFSWFAPDAGIGVITLTATANANGYPQASGSLSVSYAPPPALLAYIAISPTSAVLQYPGSQTFTATCYDEYSNPIPSCIITWNLSTPSLGTLDNNTSPTVTFTAKNPGPMGSPPKTETITALGFSGYNQRQATTTLQILSIPDRSFQYSVQTPSLPQMNTPFTITVTITNTGSIAQDFTVSLAQTDTSPKGSFGVPLDQNSDPITHWIRKCWGANGFPLNPLANGQSLPYTTPTQTIHLSPNQTGSVQFQIVDFWNWIAPWDLSQLECALLWFITGYFVTKGLGDTYDKLFSIFTGANLLAQYLNYFTQTSVSNGQTSIPHYFVFGVWVPIWKELLYFYSVLITMFLGLDFSLTGVTSIIGAIPGLLAEVLAIADSQLAYIDAQDPPSNYRQLFTPHPTTLINGTQFNQLPAVQKLPTDQRSFIQDLLNYVEAQNATTVSLNRYGTALANGDNRSALTQLQAAHTWSLAKGQIWQNVTTKIANGVLPMSTNIDASTVQAAQLSIASNGLPPLEQELLRGLGLAAQIPTITNYLLTYNYTFFRTTSILIDSQRMQQYLTLEANTIGNMTVQQPPTAVPVFSASGLATLLWTLAFAAPVVSRIRSHRRKENLQSHSDGHPS